MSSTRHLACLDRPPTVPELGRLFLSACLLRDETPLLGSPRLRPPTASSSQRRRQNPSGIFSPPPTRQMTLLPSRDLHLLPPSPSGINPPTTRRDSPLPPSLRPFVPQQHSTKTLDSSRRRRRRLRPRNRDSVRARWIARCAGDDGGERGPAAGGGGAGRHRLAARGRVPLLGRRPRRALPGLRPQPRGREGQDGGLPPGAPHQRPPRRRRYALASPQSPQRLRARRDRQLSVPHRLPSSLAVQ